MAGRWTGVVVVALVALTACAGDDTSEIEDQVGEIQDHLDEIDARLDVIEAQQAQEERDRQAAHQECYQEHVGDSPNIFNDLEECS